MRLEIFFSFLQKTKKLNSPKMDNIFLPNTKKKAEKKIGRPQLRPTAGPETEVFLKSPDMISGRVLVHHVTSCFQPKSDVSSHALLANIPLAVLDAAICWWISFDTSRRVSTLITHSPLRVVKPKAQASFCNGQWPRVFWLPHFWIYISKVAYERVWPQQKLYVLH